MVDGWERKLEPINRIEVSEQKISANYESFAKKRPEAEFWPVIKANAYGCGIEQIAGILDKNKFEYWVADSYQEALRVWTGSKKKVLLIGPMRSENYQYLDFERITLGIQNVEDLEVLGKLGRKVRVHLEIETGMNRQGFASEEMPAVVKILKKYPKIEMEGVFSHLADADNEDNSFTKKQEMKFTRWLDELEKEGIKPRWVHLAATAGVLKTTDLRINAVRLGMGLYRGGVRLESRVVKVRKVVAGEKVSYNCTYEMPKEGWLGVIPVGYFEALDRKLSNLGAVKYKEKIYPIVGRICMNMCVVNFGKVKPGLWDEVEVEGADGENSFGENAKKCGTIDYEMMTRLNGTIRRAVVENFDKIY